MRGKFGTLDLANLMMFMTLVLRAYVSSLMAILFAPNANLFLRFCVLMEGRGVVGDV
jgi:hypothetical protein